MSRVTNVLLTFAMSEETAERMAEVDAYFAEGGPDAGVSKGAGFRRIEEEVGGTKALEAELYAGAFNYLHLPTLLRYLATRVRWDSPERVQLFVKEEEKETWQLLNVWEAAR